MKLLGLGSKLNGKTVVDINANRVLFDDGSTLTLAEVEALV